MSNAFRSLVLVVSLLSTVATGCATSESDVRSETPEFENAWTQLLRSGVEVHRVAPGSDGDDLTGSLGGSAGDSVSGLLSSAMPATSSGPLTAPEVDRAMRERLSAVRMCQAQASRREPLPSGRVVVRFQVATTGAVENVQVEGPRFTRTPLLGCLATAVRRLQFRPSTGQPFAAAYPFIFGS